jgi:hypothetical protein
VCVLQPSSLAPRILIEAANTKLSGSTVLALGLRKQAE